MRPRSATSFPEQRLTHPGLESEVDPPPRYEAPRYRAAGKLASKVALITGGDSGIGRAIALLYAGEGADVAIAYLPGERPDAEVVRRGAEAEGRRCLLLPGDLREEEFCFEAVQRTVEELGRLDVLVSNAAYLNSRTTLDELTLDDVHRTFQTNIFSYFALVRAAVPHLEAGASIIASGLELHHRRGDRADRRPARQPLRITGDRHVAPERAPGPGRRCRTRWPGHRRP